MFEIGKRQFECDVFFSVPGVEGVKGLHEVSLGVRYEVAGTKEWEACNGDAETGKLIVKRVFGVFDGGQDISGNDDVIDKVINDPFACAAIIKKYISIVYGGGSLKEQAEKN